MLQQQLHVLRRGPGGQLPARRALPRRGAVPRGRAGLPRPQGEAVRHLQPNILSVTMTSVQTCKPCWTMFDDVVQYSKTGLYLSS